MVKSAEARSFFSQKYTDFESARAYLAVAATAEFPREKAWNTVINISAVTKQHKIDFAVFIPEHYKIESTEKFNLFCHKRSYEEG